MGVEVSLKGELPKNAAPDWELVGRDWLADLPQWL